MRSCSGAGEFERAMELMLFTASVGLSRGKKEHWCRDVVLDGWLPWAWVGVDCIYIIGILGWGGM